MEKVIKIKDIVEALSLKVLAGEESLEKEILLAEIHYPGLELTGYLMNYSREINNSIHIFGNKEINYLNNLDEKSREYNLINYFSYDFPCLIFLKNINVSEEIIKVAKNFKRPLLVSEEEEDKFDEKITTFLRRVLGPEIVINNFTLLEVFGIGILLSGNDDCRVGSILELIRKNHRLVAENAVNIKRFSHTLIIGSSLKSENDNKHSIQLSSGNSFKVSEYFGIGAVRNSKEIDLLIKVEEWDDEAPYDRLGVKYLKQNILGVEIPKITIPFKKGRNVSILIEVAAMNRRLQKRGKNSALIFMEKLIKLIKEKNGPQSNNLIKIQDIKTKFKFKLLNKPLNEEMIIKRSEIYRPSIEFAECFKDVQSLEHVIHAIGEPEVKYLETLSKDKRDKLLNNYFSINFPCLIVSYEKKVPDFIVKKALKENIPLFQTRYKLNSFMVDLTDYIATELSLGTVMHGVFIEIFGVGVLLTGKSGLGKSETALELIHRGHRLVADDIVKLNRLRDGRIIGKASKIPHFMEVRGLGIIDVKTLYGVGAVKNIKELSLIIELYEFENHKEDVTQNYVEEYKKILGKKIKKINFYVTPGRSIASIIEILSMKVRKRN